MCHIRLFPRKKCGMMDSMMGSTMFKALAIGALAYVGAKTLYHMID